MIDQWPSPEEEWEAIDAEQKRRWRSQPHWPELVKQSHIIRGQPMVKKTTRSVEFFQVHVVTFMKKMPMVTPGDPDRHGRDAHFLQDCSTRSQLNELFAAVSSAGIEGNLIACPGYPTRYEQHASHRCSATTILSSRSWADTFDSDFEAEIPPSFISITRTEDDQCKMTRRKVYRSHR